MITTNIHCPSSSSKPNPYQSNFPHSLSPNFFPSHSGQWSVEEAILLSRFTDRVSLLCRVIFIINKINFGCLIHAETERTVQKYPPQINISPHIPLRPIGSIATGPQPIRGRPRLKQVHPLPNFIFPDWSSGGIQNKIR